MAHHAHKKPHHVTPSYTTAFIDAHVADAQVVSMKYGIPASAILAQAALESKWGRAAPGNAFFGVKGKAPDGQSVMEDTHERIKGKLRAEKDAFRAYDSFAAAADDYANVISTNKLFATVYANRTDPNKYAESMGHSPYATGAGYGKLMKDIIHDHNLTQYDK